MSSKQTHTHTDIHIHIHSLTHTHIHTITHTHTHTYIHIHTHTHTYKNTHTHWRTHSYTHTHKHTHTHIHNNNKFKVSHKIDKNLFSPLLLSRTRSPMSTGFLKSIWSTSRNWGYAPSKIELRNIKWEREIKRENVRLKENMWEELRDWKRKHWRWIDRQQYGGNSQVKIVSKRW